MNQTQPDYQLTELSLVFKSGTDKRFLSRGGARNPYRATGCVIYSCKRRLISYGTLARFPG
jgi:hypothetical protein